MRHPHGRPTPALCRGMMPLTPVPTASSMITPLPPPVTRIKTRIRWFKLGARHFAARCPPVTAGVDTTTTTVRKVVTTPPPARGSGGHPWRHHASSCFFRRVQNDMFAPLQGTKHKIGAPSRTPSWLPPPLHPLHRNGPMWFRNSVDPRFPPPIEDGSSHSPHAVPTLPTLPTRCGITRSVSRNAAKLLWTCMLTQMPMRGQPSDHSPT